MSRESLIEIACHGLLAGMLLWQPLRDAAAIALLVLLVSEATAADEGPAAKSLPLPWRWPVGAFFAANLLSAAAAHDASVSFATLRFYPLGLLLFLGARRTVASGGGQRLAAVTVAILTLFGVDEMRQYLSGSSWLRQSAPVWGRFQGALVYPSDVSLLAILLPIGTLAFLGRERWRLAAAGGVVVLVAVAISLSGTRAAFGGLLLFGITAGWIHGRPRISAAIVAIALVVFAATAGLGLATVGRRILSPATYRAENRLPQWHAAVVLFRESPILGHGPHSFRDIVTARHAERDFRRIKLKYAPYPHNIYLEALCGTGVAGLAALLWLMWTAAASLYRLRASPTARAALVSLAAFATIGFVDLSLVKDWVQVSFWLPLAVAAGLSSSGGGDETATAGPAGDVLA